VLTNPINNKRSVKLIEQRYNKKSVPPRKVSTVYGSRSIGKYDVEV